MYKVGIIGCGRIAGGFEYLPNRIFPSTHAGAYLANPLTKLIAICDKDAGRLEQFSKKWKIKNCFNNHKKMLKTNSLDLLSICTHEDTHYEIISDAIELGVKNIFCEKPRGKNSAEIIKILSLCDKNQVNLIVNHTRRWNDKFIYVKNFINHASLGSITSITGRYTSGIRVIGSHMLDIMRFLVGEIKFIHGLREKGLSVLNLSYSENFNSQDHSYSGIMYFENGTIGFLDGSARKKYLIFEIEIQFEKGKLILSDNGQTLSIWQHDKVKLIQVENEIINEKPMMANAVQHITEVISNHAKNNICNGDDGLKVIQLIEALEKSSQEDFDGK